MLFDPYRSLSYQSHASETNNSALDENNNGNCNTVRNAFVKNSTEASKLLHDASLNHEENHPVGGNVLKSIIFGGLDGILTAFAVVSGAAGGGLSPSVTVLLGISSIVADAVAMGLGDYLSNKAHRDFVISEEERERWELRNYREGEIWEMINVFTKRGMDR